MNRTKPPVEFGGVPCRHTRHPKTKTDKKLAFNIFIFINSMDYSFYYLPNTAIKQFFYWFLMKRIKTGRKSITETESNNINQHKTFLTDNRCDTNANLDAFYIVYFLQH